MPCAMCGWNIQFASVESVTRWNEWGFRPPLCTYRLNRAWSTSWGWWDDTARQTQDSKFEPWRFKAEHATSRSRRHSTVLNHYGWAGKKLLVSLKLEGESGVRTRGLLLSKQASLTTTSGPTDAVTTSTDLGDKTQCCFNVGPASQTSGQQ